MQPNPFIFGLLLLAAVGYFCFSCYRRFSLVTLGLPENRFEEPAKRAGKMLLYAFGQLRVIRKPFGVNHFIIFWSFVLLLLANGEFLLRGILPNVRLALLPESIYHPLLFVFDVVSLLALISVAVAAVRRAFFPPAYLETTYMKARSFEAFLILSFIALLMLAYFGLHGAEIALGLDEAGGHMPVSSYVAGMLSTLSPEGVHAFALASWWVHAIILLVFMNLLPRSKHMHILTAIPNCYFQSLENPNTQPVEQYRKGNVYGAGRVDRFTWKDLFDSYSCTECGRCQNVCPGTNTGKSLNPRHVIHDIKINLLQNGELLKSENAPALPLIGGSLEGSVSEETIWSCTTCGACMAVCPVFIEQMPKLIKMRRHLVQMESRFPEELLNLFENMESRSNPWGIAPTERTKWHATLDVRPFEKGSTEYLFYVGCAGSFDARQKHVTVALATIFDAAGLSWGILGKEEKCCGDSLRRLGNEYVFDRMARENVQLFKEKGVSKVIVQCPHCLSTLKNDYRQYGLEIEVIHHGELLNRLLAEGRLKLNRQVTELGKMLFHDSCYLGRHNDVYDPPRQALLQATGRLPVEMSRYRGDAFCCGAGGGRMWMEEHSGTRINIARVEEALENEPDTICVACPYCMTMFEDGLKDKQAADVKVRDLAEVVAEGLRR